MLTLFSCHLTTFKRLPTLLFVPYRAFTSKLRRSMAGEPPLVAGSGNVRIAVEGCVSIFEKIYIESSR